MKNLVEVSFLSDTLYMDDSPRLELVDTDPVVAEMVARAWMALALASAASSDAHRGRGGREQP